MRKIFSSQRVETAEGVAKLLREAGIEVRISNGRSYHSKRSGQFSYLEQGNAQMHPTVWIVHANDQPRARELLRDARLLDTTRRDVPNALYTFADSASDGERPARNWGWRIRVALLLVIGAIALFIVLHRRSLPPPAPAPAAAPHAAPTQPATPAPPAEPEQEDPSRVRIQPAH